MIHSEHGYGYVRVNSFQSLSDYEKSDQHT